MLRVVDLNHWKKDVNLNAIPYDAVIVKATGGIGFVDSSCDNFIQQAIAAGKPFGFYHYFSDGFNDGDPIAEANWFVDNCQGYFGHGIPILDWERGGNPDVGNPAKALQFLQHVEARTGIKPLIYMSLSLITSMNWSAVVANNNGLWCADYVDNNTPIPNYSMDANRDPNPHWDGNVNDVLWQFTSTGRLDGYGGNLDCSFFYGTRATWDAYAGSHPAPTPPVPEPTTTTTTEAPAPVEPDPTTTTTTETPTTDTTTTQPETPATTTTTTSPAQPSTPGQSAAFWAAVWAFLINLFKVLTGRK